MLPGLSDVVVYGVTVPGCEGRAGMAAVVESDKVELDSVAAAVTSKLPGYARPYFLRLTPQLDMTGTYKLKKRDLQLQGFNLADISDKIFFLDVKSSKYIPLDTELYSGICSGKVRI